MPGDHPPYPRPDQNPQPALRSRPRRPRRHRRAPASLPRLAVLTLGCVAVSTTGAFTFNTMTRSVPPAAAADINDGDRTAITDRASRDKSRTDPSAVPPALSGSPAPGVPVPPSTPSVPALPRPVSGLNQAQMNNAKAIVEAGRKLNVPRRAHVVAITTALQESNLRVLANPTVPESMRKPHEGSARDHDSLGLFQQRPSQGWGSVNQLMLPGESSRLFYAKLLKIKGWETLPIATAAQKVQRSAFPDAYAKHQTRAEQIVDALI